MCIRCETREKARRSLAFSRVSKPHTHITHMLRQCTSIVYLFGLTLQYRNTFLAQYSHLNEKGGTKLVLEATTLTLHDILLSCKCFSYLFLLLFILEGPPTFGMTPDSVTIDYHISVNSRVMDIQITDLGFIQKVELDYDSEYFYFDTHLRMYWRHLLQ
jgi:hypothetical protein